MNTNFQPKFACQPRKSNKENIITHNLIQFLFPFGLRVLIRFNLRVRFYYCFLRPIKSNRHGNDWSYVNFTVSTFTLTITFPPRVPWHWLRFITIQKTSLLPTRSELGCSQSTRLTFWRQKGCQRRKRAYLIHLMVSKIWILRGCRLVLTNRWRVVQCVWCVTGLERIWHFWVFGWIPTITVWKLVKRLHKCRLDACWWRIRPKFRHFQQNLAIEINTMFKIISVPVGNRYLRVIPYG